MSKRDFFRTNASLKTCEWKCCTFARTRRDTGDVSALSHFNYLFFFAITFVTSAGAPHVFNAPDALRETLRKHKAECSDNDVRRASR
ncbi:MAG: hypothetical protein CTY15_11110 [Methylocystis sp.]|nr:MAG: hypothetical protein CTY15_11110 [Methylocystis sp.]